MARTPWPTSELDSLGAGSFLDKATKQIADLMASRQPQASSFSDMPAPAAAAPAPTSAPVSFDLKDWAPWNDAAPATSAAGGTPAAMPSASDDGWFPWRQKPDVTMVDGRQQPQPSLRPGESVGDVSMSSGPRGQGSDPEKQAQVYQQARMSGLDDEGARVLVAVTETEGGLQGALGDQGRSRGPFQFFEGGQMPGFRAWVQRQGIQGDPDTLVHDVGLATRYAAEGYLGQAIRDGRAQGLSGADLATYVQRHGQVSENPERTGANYQRLYGGASSAPNAGAGTPPSPAPTAPAQTAASSPAPSAAGAPTPGGVGPITVRDQWGNTWQTTQAALDKRPGGYGDLTILPGPMQKTGGDLPADDGMSAGDQKRAKMGYTDELRGGASVVGSNPTPGPNIDTDLGSSAVEQGASPLSLYRQPLQPTMADTATGDYVDPDQGPHEGAQPDLSPPQPSYNDPTDGGTQSQPLPSQQPDYQYQNGGDPTPSAQYTEVPTQRTQYDTQIVDGRTAPPTPNGDWQPLPQQPVAASYNDPTTDGTQSQPLPSQAASSGDTYLDLSVPAPPGWAAMVNGAGAVVDWVRHRAQDAGQAAQGVYQAVSPYIQPAGGLPAAGARIREINDIAARDQGKAPTDIRAQFTAADDPAWRAQNPDLAAEYDQLQDAYVMGVGGMVGAGGEHAPTAPDTVAAPNVVQRVRGAISANAERVAAADARMAEQGSATAGATFGSSWDDFSRNLDRPEDQAAREASRQQPQRPANDQLIREQYGRPIDEVARDPASAQMREESGSITRPRNQVNAEDAANLSGPAEQYPNMEGRMNATFGAGPNPGGTAQGVSGGTGKLGSINRAMGQGIQATAAGGIGAAANQQANPDDPNAGIKGFVAGALAPPLIKAGAGRLARALGHEGAAADGALATFGASPGGARRRLRSQAIPGQQDIKMTPGQEVSRLRLDRFPEELRSDIQKGAESTGFAHEQRRGVLPDQAVQDLADTDTRSVDTWISQGRAGRAYNPEETVALRNAVTTQANTVRDMSQRIASAQAEGLDPVLLTARRVAEAQKLAALVQTAEGARAEAGRTLRAYRATTRILDSNDPSEAARRIFKNVSADPEEAARLLESFDGMVQGGASPIDIAKFWGKVENPPVGWKDWFVALRYNSMLSGLSTHLVNIVGNATEIPWRLIRDTGASIGRGDLRPMRPEVKGIASGFSAGLHAAGEALVNGLTTAEAEKGGIPRDLINRARNPVEKGAAVALEIPGRLLGAADQLGQQIAYHMGLGREAGLQASKEGLKGTAWNERVAELMANPPDALSQAAQGVSDRMTFKGDMGRNGAALNQFLRKIDPALSNIIMPFLKTVYHITARGIDRSPLGAAGTALDVAKGKYAAGKALESGMVPLGERVGDNLMGTGVFGLGAYWALNGNLSASGPADPADRDALRAQGWQPYSVKIGGKWVSYANLGPLAMPLSMAAAVGESQRYKDATKPSEVQFLEGGKRFGEVFTEQTYLNSFGQLYKAMTDPVKYGDAYTTSLVGSMVPYGSALNAVGMAQDPVARRPERFQDVGFAENTRQSLASRGVPFTGGRESVPAAQDILGRPDPNTRYGFEAASPLRTSQERPDPTIQAFLDANVNIGRPPSTISAGNGAQVDLTPAEQRSWQTARGALLEQFASKFRDAPWWQNPDAREKAMRSLISDANQAASARIQSSLGSQEIIRRVQANRAKKAS